MSESGKYFNEMAAGWDQNSMRNHIANMVSRSVHKHVPIKKDAVMLDFGCGTGLVSFFFYPHLARLDGVDTSGGMVDAFNSKAAENGFDKASARIYSKENPLRTDAYDVVVSSMVFHHIENPRDTLKEIYSSLKPGGFAAIADLDREDGTFHPPTVPGVYHKGFERAVMLEWFAEAGFAECTAKTAVTIDKEGKSYPIFLCVGRRPR